MFYDAGTVKDIVEPLDTAGPWKLKDVRLSDRPAIPCFSCHQVHQAGNPGKRQNLEISASMHYSRMKETLTSFYYRRDNMYFPVLLLASPKVNYQSVSVRISQDPDQSLCLQCHSPNGFNMSGTDDDRTPRGVHEGISCLACHDSHSNSALALHCRQIYRISHDPIGKCRHELL